MEKGKKKDLFSHPRAEVQEAGSGRGSICPGIGPSRTTALETEKRDT